MYIKISKKSQLVILRNMNAFLDKHKIPKEVLHELGNILEFERSSKRDYIALFLKPVKNDSTEIMDELQLYPLRVELSDNNFYNIKVKGKKKRIWSWYDIKNENDKRRVFVVYPMRKKDLYRKGGF